ncbi:MAG: DNA-deoxyinosine glycosylase [Oscillospiraceae bacterium]|nr:DNA-deoxyinosine glycosylase [Oscillospiraceae bacterium]
MEKHNFGPLYNENSKILILGSFPSVKSRQAQFFYGHPQNRFWNVLSALFGHPAPQTIEEKRDLILKNNLALWDVIGRCDIVGSSDSSIKNVVPNDIGAILKKTKIEKIFVNGKTAEKYYNKYLKDKLGIEAIVLPSTSPANAAYSLERLTSEWQIILK